MNHQLLLMNLQYCCVLVEGLHMNKYEQMILIQSTFYPYKIKYHMLQQHVFFESVSTSPEWQRLCFQELM